MYCSNCGTKIPDGALFCPNCGQKVKDAVQPAAGSEKATAAAQPAPAAAAAPAKEKTHFSVGKVFKGIGTVIAILIVILAVMMYLEERPINVVKSGTLDAFPDKTVGDAFEGYFENTSWDTYEEDGDQYVEFVGDFPSDNTLDASRARVLFLVDGNNGEITSFIVDGIDILAFEDLGTLSMYGYLTEIYQ